MNKPHIHEIEVDTFGDRTCKQCWLSEATIEHQIKMCKCYNENFDMKDPCLNCANGNHDEHCQQDDCHCHRNCLGFREDNALCLCVTQECEHCTQQKDAGEKSFKEQVERCLLIAWSMPPFMSDEDVEKQIAGIAEAILKTHKKLVTQARQQAFTEALEAVGEDDNASDYDMDDEGLNQELYRTAVLLNNLRAEIRANIEKRRKG